MSYDSHEPPSRGPLWTEPGTTVAAGMPQPSPPVRVCRKCAVQSHTTEARCPNCGASYLRGLRRFQRRRTRVLVVAVPVLVLLSSAAAGAYLKIEHDADVRERREAAEQRARDEAEAREQAKQDEAEQQAALDELEIETRESAVKELEQNIESDAEENVAEGILDGPILETQCDATTGAPEELETTRGEFDCLAANERSDDGTIEGYRYSGSIDYESGELRWRLGGA